MCDGFPYYNTIISSILLSIWFLVPVAEARACLTSGFGRFPGEAESGPCANLPLLRVRLCSNTVHASVVSTQTWINPRNKTHLTNSSFSFIKPRTGWSCAGSFLRFLSSVPLFVPQFQHIQSHSASREMTTLLFSSLY